LQKTLKRLLILSIAYLLVQNGTTLKELCIIREATMKDIVEAERVALALVLKLTAYRHELENKFERSRAENRDFARLSEVSAVLKQERKVMKNQKGYAEWAGLVMTAVLTYGLGASLLFGTGCFSAGYEVGGRLGIYRVDSRSDSSATLATPTPWKCYLIPCGNVTATPLGVPANQ
jgi:hypothetical protein